MADAAFVRGWFVDFAAAQPVVPAFADHAAPEAAHLLLVLLAEITDGADARVFESLHHPRADASEFLCREMADHAALGSEIFVAQDDEAVGLLHVGSEFGEGAVWGDADGGSHPRTAARVDGIFDVEGELPGALRIALETIEPTRNFVDGVDLVDRNAGVHGGNNPVVHEDIEARARVENRDRGAEAFGLTHACAGLDAELLGLIAGSDAAASIADDGRDGDGPASELRRHLLLHRGEVGVEVDEKGGEGQDPIV